jgi:branched-chain amino acid transport system ATP-binding protein
MALLEVREIHTYYGHIHALQGISLEVDEGEIVTLIGANGAGKTTTLNTICGLLNPRRGEIWLDDQPIHETKPHHIVRMGVAQVPEGRKIFGRLTVWENLEMGAYAREDKAAIQKDAARVLEIFPQLKGRERQLGGTLSGGEQQMLAMGRALMARPRILLLDEPSMGLAPILVESVFNTIQEINRQGTTVLLVEQNALMALSVAHRGYVLQTGRIILQDSAKSLQENKMVQDSYLGVA